MSEILFQLWKKNRLYITSLKCTLTRIFCFYRFVDKYAELKSNSELDDGALFEETAKALLKDGITLRRRGAPFVSIKQIFLFSLERAKYIFVSFSKYIHYQDRRHFNSVEFLQYLPKNFIRIYLLC